MKTSRSESQLPFSIDELEYHIIKIGNPQSYAKQERIYTYWRKFWQEIFAKMGHPDKPIADELLRQNVISCISKGDEVIALHFYTFFDLTFKPTLEHSYFEAMTEETSCYLKDRGFNYLMSMEYLTVDPQWRKSLTGVSFSDTMINLSQRFLLHSGCNAGFGTARMDLHVDRNLIAHGWVLNPQVVKRYDYECRWCVVEAKDHGPHPSAQVNIVADHLWANRKDETGLTHLTRIGSRAAA